MKNLISRVQRELPDTDKDRYDVAYERGATQKRSGMLFGGLAAGAVAGLVGMYLLDPLRGAARRSQIASRLGGLGNDVARTATAKAEDLRNKAKGAAESGGSEPARFDASAPEHRNGSTADAAAADQTAAVAVGTAIATDASASAAPAPSGIDAPTDAALTGPNGIVASPDFERPVLDADLGNDAPGSDVANPLTPEELEAFGPSGPVAGAATLAANEEAARDAANQGASTNEEAAPAD
ncbi:MAG: hypothetical protein ACJ77B_11470 [Chloroflexota bacterium]